jgi:hypothetical protein
VAEHRDRGRLEVMIAALASDADGDRLMRALLGHCWPGGVGDRSEPAARDWVSRWHPRRSHAPCLVCDCASGRCALCN